MKITKRVTFISGGSTSPNPLNLIDLGFRGNEYRQDLSDYVIHFTKGIDDDAAYRNLLSILYQGRIRRGKAAFGISREILALQERNRAVCFSETPLGYLSSLVDRRSLYGIGFRKDLIASRGGNQICYVDSNSQFARALRTLKTIAKQREEHDRRKRRVDLSNPIWDICPFIECTFHFGRLQHRFEWEREWRVLNDFDFTPDEVEFLLIPEELHAEARRFFEDVERNHNGPAYLCPYIDPRWNLDRFLPLNERLEQKLKDVISTLEDCAARLKEIAIAPDVVEDLIRAIQSFELPTDHIPEAIGQGWREVVLWDETRELPFDEFDALIKTKSKQEHQVDIPVPPDDPSHAENAVVCQDEKDNLQ